MVLQLAYNIVSPLVPLTVTFGTRMGPRRYISKERQSAYNLIGVYFARMFCIHYGEMGIFDLVKVVT